MSNEQNKENGTEWASNLISIIAQILRLAGEKMLSSEEKPDSEDFSSRIKVQGLQAFNDFVTAISTWKTDENDNSENKELEEINSLLENSPKDSISKNTSNTNNPAASKKRLLSIPINKQLDLEILKFSNSALDLETEDKDFIAYLRTAFTVDIKGITLSLSNCGVGIRFKSLLDQSKSTNIEAILKYPNGIGIGIDVNAVKGAGIIQWEKNRFSSAVELTILEKFSVSTMFVIATKPFSLMAALNTEFNPGIQIGMGFAITGIGGSLGINRGLDVDNLTNAVYDGSLSSILFVRDIKKNFDKILANVDKFYPIRDGQMYFGLLAQITWGTKALFKADVGLFIQAPEPLTIILAGVIHVRVKESLDKLLSINADFIGAIQFDKGISLDASLFDSQIVGLDLYGDIAMRIYWGGETKGFVLTVGGFHPQYKPDSGFNLPALKRVGLKLDHKILKMSLDTYFAITSNTVQFGAAFFMCIGWEKFGITGNAAFNALFQFNPFAFTVDMSAGLAVKLGRCTLCGISLAFELSGPAQWHAKGRAEFWVVIKIKVNFNLTWGKTNNGKAIAPTNVYALFHDEFSNKEKERTNWTVISSDQTDNMVTLQSFDNLGLIIAPNDTIVFNQSAVPFNQDMDFYGESKIDDFCKLELEEVYIGDAPIKELKKEKSSFAPSLIQKMSDKEKLTVESYKDMESGFSTTNFTEKKNGNAESSEKENPSVQYMEITDKFKHWKERSISKNNNKNTQEAIHRNIERPTTSNKFSIENRIKKIKVSQAKDSKRTRKEGVSSFIKAIQTITKDLLQKDSSENLRSPKKGRTLKASHNKSSVGIERYIKQMNELIRINPQTKEN